MRCLLADRYALPTIETTTGLPAVTSLKTKPARVTQRMRAKVANQVNSWMGRTSISQARPCCTTQRKTICQMSRPAMTSTHASWNILWSKRCRKMKLFTHPKSWTMVIITFSGVKWPTVRCLSPNKGVPHASQEETLPIKPVDSVPQQVSPLVRKIILPLLNRALTSSACKPLRDRRRDWTRAGSSTITSLRI